MRKVQPSDRLRKEIQTFFEGMGSLDNGAEALSELVRLASTLMVQEGLEAEQADFVGRERYQRGERNGYRSGYKPGKLDTAEGRLQVDVPQIRDAQQPFRSKLFDLLKGDSQMLEYLATEMYARGLSTRDIAAAFTDEDGVCLLSRSGVSEVTEVLWEQYEAFQQRDLRDIPVLYLFLDGLYEPLRMHGVKREAVLCAWAITTEGHKVLLSLALGNKESYDAWLPSRPGEPRRARAAHRHQRWRSWAVACYRRGVAEELAHPLLGTPHAQLQSEGARSSVARSQSPSAGHSRCPYPRSR